MLFFFSSPAFYNTQVQFPTNRTPIVQKFSGSPCFKFFDKCIGAVDGTHIHIFSSTKDHAFMHNRKGYLSQNCLFACDFNFFSSLCCVGGTVQLQTPRCGGMPSRTTYGYLPTGTFLVTQDFPRVMRFLFHTTGCAIT